MVQMTVELPEDLAERIQPLKGWLPTLLELSLVGYQTEAVATATEVIEFLATEPSPVDILNYHVSERGQQRLERLLALNTAGLLGEPEQRELDELERIEHIVVMLKAEVAASGIGIS